MTETTSISRNDMEARSVAIKLSAAAEFKDLLEHLEQNAADLAPLSYAILLFAPEAAPPESYIPLLNRAQDLCRSTVGNAHEKEANTKMARSTTTRVSDLSPQTSYTGVHLSRQSWIASSKCLELRSLTLAEYLNERVRAIDSVTGLLEYGAALLAAFPAELVDLRVGIIRPLSILHRCGICQGIDFMESLDVAHAIAISIGGSSDNDLEQILDDVLLPWARYKNCLDELCRAISERMANSSGINLQKVLRILSTLIQSDLFLEQKRLIASGAILACYKKPLNTDGRDHTAERQTIVAILQNSFKDTVTTVPDLDKFEFSSFEDFDIVIQDENSELHDLIIPSYDSIAILHEFIDSSVLFNSVQDAVLVRLGSMEIQRQRLAKVMSTPFKDAEFKTLREQVLQQKVLTKIPNSELEFSILKSLLLGGKSTIARQIYVTTSPRPLPSTAVERAILETFNELFDNARSLSRKELSPAHLVLTVIHPKHNNTEIRANQLMIDTLIELSAYIGAQNCLPSQIRRFKAQEILGFFSRILQEADNYKKHVRLLGLYQNLCLSLQHKTDETQFRELVVNAALSFDDLDMALCTAEESQDELSENLLSTGTSENGTELQDSWRLNYQVCRYPSSSFAMTERQIMLLSRTIESSPLENLHQLTSLYKSLETSLQEHENSQRDSTVGAYRKETGTKSVPRTISQAQERFSSQSQGPKIEMPQWRLFEAAQAATRTAREYLPKTPQDGEMKDGRVRKRDQIAGIVGSGVGAMESRFTSGLGWILGADTAS